MAKFEVTKDITAQNSFSDPVALFGGGTLVISNTFSATAHLQRSRDGGSSWDDVTDVDGVAYSWTVPATVNISENTSGILYRAGVKTSNYTSGTVSIALSAQ